MAVGEFVDVANISTIIAAAGALGTAAYGLVDACKAFRGGISNAGFGAVRDGMARLIAPTGGPGIFGTTDVFATLYANWINGLPKADQKATAKSLVRLTLTPANAASLAAAVGVDPAALTAVAQKVRSGADLTLQEIGLLGRVDAIVSALIDEAYERADQRYRTWSKFTAGAVAILLAAIGGGLLYCAAGAGQNAHTVGEYLASSNFLIALLVGAISTPLAPIAKDVSTAIASAVSAVGAWKR
jgi:hypothetical protein